MKGMIYDNTVDAWFNVHLINERCSLDFSFSCLTFILKTIKTIQTSFETFLLKYVTGRVMVWENSPDAAVVEF